MRTELNIFLAGLLFYTRIPPPSWFTYQDSYLQQSAKYLPLIGALLGAVAALTYGVALSVFPASIAVLLAMVTTVVLTGAFHEDGFADVCDGFGGGWDAEQILRIMKDSRIGSYGTVGIGLLLALKYAALLALSGYGVYLVAATLITGHALSRAMAVTVMQYYPYVGDPAVSKAKTATIRRLPESAMLVVLVTASLPLALLCSLCSAPLLLLALVPAWLGRCYLARYFCRHLGGYTGDCLGAVQQVCEVLLYLGVLALCRFT